jgi:putative flippase GtrA
VKQFLRFAVVGTLGFVTDFSVLYLLVSTFGLGHLSGRLLSFIVAATVTWKANRHFTFEQKGKGSASEWLQYLLATSAGAAINIGVYQLWMQATEGSAADLFCAVAAGSVTAMLFNFAISKRVVFAK